MAVNPERPDHPFTCVCWNCERFRGKSYVTPVQSCVALGCALVAWAPFIVLGLRSPSPLGFGLLGGIISFFILFCLLGLFERNNTKASVDHSRVVRQCHCCGRIAVTRVSDRSLCGTHWECVWKYVRESDGDSPNIQHFIDEMAVEWQRQLGETRRRA